MTLKTDIANDLASVFMNTDEFADVCIYTPEATTLPADPVTITGIQTGYPTILTAVAHGLTDGATITLDDFAGEDADVLNGGETTVQFPGDDTFAIDVDTTGADITDNGNTATATAELPPETVTTKVILNKDYAAELDMEGYRYWCIGLTSIFAEAKHGETLLINGTTYKIKGAPQHGEAGETSMELSID